MTPAIAIVGMACRYPDATTPSELWANVLAQRQAFRRLPPERLRLADYWSADPQAPDRTYATEAALLEGYTFDRQRFRVAGSTFRATDMAHWLALHVAADALAAAGFPDGAGLPRTQTGVLLGNTLTGEFSRANLLRLRWPYVARQVGAALGAAGWGREQRYAFLEQLEQDFKQPFPPIGEESLAGGLANTIAGRICNYFDLNGGGYTVDGACASSLLAVAQACSALLAGDLDVALAGGVDLSLDPFELVGFAKAGALAPEQMRVFDARAGGFWPGEGCGVVVLMRHDDALAQGRHVYALIRGWGISSDGNGGITRPEVAGQLLAVQRAYRRAGFGIETVGYFEGHGTGTSVGDTTELRTLLAARGAAPTAPPAALGSIKANIGHTKAAAGVAGLIKATLALSNQLVPPTSGCETPHPLLAEPTAALQVLGQGQPWPLDRPLRAGVSAMGFGGINAHVVLEGLPAQRRMQLTPVEQTLLASAQDAELFLLGAPSLAELHQRIAQVAELAPLLARAELADLAAHLAQSSSGQPARAALVAASADELSRGLATLADWLAAGHTQQLDTRAGLFLGSGERAPRLGLLLPGQGSPTYHSGGSLRRRFATVEALYRQAALQPGDSHATAVAQPAIVTASLAALRVLEQLGLRAEVGLGHSLGELTALHWAGAIEAAALLQIAARRGQAMEALSEPPGAMLSIEAGQPAVAALLEGQNLTIACLNSPRQTVVAGPAQAVTALAAQASARGLHATLLPVARAFHSPLMADAAQQLAAYLSDQPFAPLQRTVISPTTGAALAPNADLRGLLHQQIMAPVRFMEALALAEQQVDLWIEAGPGRVLSGLAAECGSVPALAIDAGGPSLRGLLHAAGAAFALGAPLDTTALFAERFTRPLTLDWRPHFLANPCEQAPLPAQADDPPPQRQPHTPRPTATPAAAPPEAHATPLALLQQLVAERAEMPRAAVQPTDRLLGDLHLNSISVGQIVAEAARRLGLAAPIAPSDYAHATVAQVAAVLEQLRETAGPAPHDQAQRPPPGIDSWIRAFSIAWVELPALRRRTNDHGSWQVLATPDHPLAAALQAALAEQGLGGGVLVCLPAAPQQPPLALLLEGTRQALAASSRFVLVQQGGGSAVWARTLHLEAPQIATCVVDLPFDCPQASAWVLQEALAVDGYQEVRYDRDGRRCEPFLRLLPDDGAPGALPLGPGDVLLVTGGGKGITAACTLALARESGAALALLGRAQPDSDAELASQLARVAALGIRCRYLSLDISDPAAVQQAVATIEASLGPITGILHGAAQNTPRLLSALDEAEIERTLAPKVAGLHNLLAAIDPAQLRLLVTFGSIIGRSGLAGEAAYGLANAWLTAMTERFQADHPACRCLAIEWSVWADLGMGARLGLIEALAQQGITPIPPDQGIAMLRRLLAQRQPPVTVVVSGRYGALPTLRLEQPDLPFLRFLERPLLYYPGVELVVEAELSSDTDPYLDEHVFRGERLLPAVIGLEAMAQAAAALAGIPNSWGFAEVRFARPVVLPPHGQLTIRLVALQRAPGLVEVALRSSETAFQIDHFWARSLPLEAEPAPALAPAASDQLPPLGLDPARELYGGLLFQGGRFQRLQRYRQLTATGCVAELGSAADRWFGYYLPPALLLGDPGARDATIHAIQACVPHLTLLPIGVTRLVVAAPDLPGPWLMRARERLRDGAIFLYDVEVYGEGGALRERWEGLRLQVIDGAAPTRPWVAPLLGPYSERRIGELVPGAALTVALEQRGAGRHARGDQALQHALGRPAAVWRRPDGRPEVDGPQAVSLAHTGDLTLAVAGAAPLGCDIEVVSERPAAVWHDLLGGQRMALAQLIAHATGEELARAATRVWAAGECIKKAGAPIDAPLTLIGIGDWVLLGSGQLAIGTSVAAIRGMAPAVVLALAIPGGAALTPLGADATYGRWEVR